MRTAPLPKDEACRLEVLRRYRIVDTLPEVAFDELAQLSSRLCNTPMALITFVDYKRQWFKSRVGIDIMETSRDISFCAWAIHHDDLFVIADTGADDRFQDNPWVKGQPGVRFYAAMPLVTPDGAHLGTLCVLDTKPRELTTEQGEVLRILTRQVTTQLELRHHLVELARSIEEHKQTEDRLRDSEAFYQTLVESLPQNILRKDRQGRFTFANRKFCKSIGKPLKEILGCTDFDLFPTDLANKYHRDDLRVMATLENLDTVEAHQSASGGKMFVHVLKTPLYDAVGQVIGIQGIFWDVTQRKKIEEALAYERDLLSALLDNIPDRIYFKDVNSRFLRCSMSMVRRLGLSDQTEVVGKTDFDFHPKALSQEFFDDEQRIILTGQPLINKLERQSDIEGREIWASVTKVPIYNQSGGVTGIIGISRDVTQLKQAEVALEQARDAALESARVKSEFLANMSHEIRTPMNAITGMTGLLIDSKLSQEQMEYVETIRNSTAGLLAIINDILDFSKIEAGKLIFEVIDFDLREAVESTVEMLAERAQKKGLELVCSIDHNLPQMLRGDPGRFRQIIANLVSNAVKFTEKGHVLVRVAKVGETDSTVVTHLSVTDTGIGLDPRIMPLIFQSFTQADGSTTRKYGGTGLGLTISKQLVELMHGEIGVESVFGQGSTFWFKLSFERNTLAAEMTDAEGRELAGLKLLLVDNSPVSSRVLRERLGHWGTTHERANNEAQALSVLREAARANRPFDLALLEMDLNDTDGLTIAQAIKSDPLIAGTRIVILTLIGRRLNTAVMQSAGISACLVKPVREGRLFECLIDVMAAPPASGTPIVGLAPRRSPLRAVGGIRVLVAEDNLVNQQLALRQLKKLGYPADSVANGAEVLNALRQVPYDIILMDCQMPELDGYEVTKRIRDWERDHTMPLKSSPYIIALTANALHGDREKCLAAGMNDYLTKPLHTSELELVLQRAQQQVHPDASTTTPSDELLDQAVIAGLKELREPNEPDPLRQLIELFLKDTHPRLQQMHSAVASREPPKLVAAAHSLKGSASNLGARRLSSLCAALEKEAKAGDIDEAARILQQVEAQFEQVHHALLAELEK